MTRCLLSGRVEKGTAGRRIRMSLDGSGVACSGGHSVLTLPVPGGRQRAERGLTLWGSFL